MAQIIDTRGKLLAEAGTGTGKTLAYLVPALASGEKTVVSTGTKNLQEQILTQDLPLVERAAGRSFDVVVLKGRPNYLCEARFEHAASQLALPGFTHQRELEEVAEWRSSTQTGDRAELADLADASGLWRELSVSSEQCRGRRCHWFEDCWVTQARRRAQQADLVVVNHHLYFADASLRQRLGEVGTAILPPHELVVFDEAHEIDEIAASHFGIEVSEHRMRDLSRDIGRTAGSDAGLLARLSRPLGELDLYAGRLFDALPFGPGRRGLESDDVTPDIRAHHDALDGVLARLDAELQHTDLEEATPLRRRCGQLAAELAFALFAGERASMLSELERPLDEHPIDPLDQRPPDEIDDDERLQPRVPFVRYLEGSRRNRRLAARPLDVAPLLGRVLETIPSVYVSATLAVGGEFSHFRRRTGLDVADELLVESPFDFQTQTRLYVPVDLPTPDAPEFPQAASERVATLAEASGGGAFVLCTSYRMLEAMGERLRQRLDLDILVQGQAPKGHLVRRFKEDGHAVLVATMSFWRGVDVPGPALRLVVIDRLPFASPGDPVVAARLRYLESKGDSPFRTYQLPQAALLLRQGFGRLVRRQTDRGLVAILDRRIVEKGYGKKLLKSLPVCPRLNDLAQARAWLETVRAE